MVHVVDGTIRRFLDEPFAVADRDARHLNSCARCKARTSKITSDAALSKEFLAISGELELDADELVLRHVRFEASSATAARAAADLRIRSPRRWRLMGASLGTGATFAIGGVALVGVAAAATLTTIFAPTQVAPVQVSPADVQQLASLTGLSGSGLPGGFSTPSGSKAFAFGTLNWTSSGASQEVPSLASAEAATGLSFTPPSTLPNGIGGVHRVVALGKVTASIAFNSAAGQQLAGSTLTINLGPGIAVSYGGSSSGTKLPVLAVAEVVRPVATSSGASVSQLENFLLSRPGVPADLAAEIRLLGNDKLPIPTPPGVNSSSTTVNGAPAVVISDPSGSASGVVFEDTHGVVHVAAGLLSESDLLNVAQQIG